MLGIDRLLHRAYLLTHSRKTVVKTVYVLYLFIRQTITFLKSFLTTTLKIAAVHFSVNIQSYNYIQLHIHQ